MTTATDYSITSIRTTKSRTPGYVVFETTRATGAFESRRINDDAASQHLYELRACNVNARVWNLADVFVRYNGRSLAPIVGGRGRVVGRA